MEFHISNEYVRHERRKAVYVTLFLTVVCAGLVVKVLSTHNISDLFFPIIGLLVLVPPVIGSYKHIKEGKAAYPSLKLDEQNGKVAVLHKDLKVIVDLSQIRDFRLQRKSGQLAAILVKTSSGENLRFAGYENLDVLVSAIEGLKKGGGGIIIRSIEGDVLEKDRQNKMQS